MYIDFNKTRKIKENDGFKNFVIHTVNMEVVILEVIVEDTIPSEKINDFICLILYETLKHERMRSSYLEVIPTFLVL